MAEAIANFLSHPTARDSLTRREKEIFTSVYSAPIMADAYHVLYETTLKKVQR